MNIESMRFSTDECRKITGYKYKSNDELQIINAFEDKLESFTKWDLIASSSLHGLTFAIALNKPFIWFTVEGETSEPLFKYNDLFSFFKINVKRFSICESNLAGVIAELNNVVTLSKKENGNFAYDGFLSDYIYYINPETYDDVMNKYLQTLQTFV